MERDLDWLGGIWDGEGCFGIVPSRNRRGGRQLFVNSALVNTSNVIILEARRILDTHGIAYHVAQRPTTLGTRAVWTLAFSGMKRSKRLIDLLRPHVRGKAAAADIVGEYIRLRLEAPHNAPLTPKLVDLFFALRDLQGYAPRESSETLRSALLKGYREAMIKSDLPRNRQSAAEMTVPA